MSVAPYIDEPQDSVVWANGKSSPETSHPMLIASILLMSASLALPGAARATTLKAGDILVTDNSTRQLVRVDAVTGDHTVISSGGLFVELWDVAVEADGQLLVGDLQVKAIFRVDPASGSQAVVSSGGHFLRPQAIALEADGSILIADNGDIFPSRSDTIFRIDPVTGSQTVVATGGFLNLQAIEVEADGNILVVDGQGDRLWRVDPSTGNKTIVSAGGLFIQPFRGLAVETDGSILVTDIQANALFRVDPVTGTQVQVTTLSGGSGLAVEADGNIILADHRELYRVDPITGAKTLLTSGFPSVKGIAIYNPPTPAAVSESVSELVDAGTLNSGEGKALTHQLDVAQKQVDGDNASAAIGQLSAFINKVTALIVSGRLTEDEGQSLIDAVNAIIEQLIG